MSAREPRRSRSITAPVASSKASKRPFGAGGGRRLDRHRDVDQRAGGEPALAVEGGGEFGDGVRHGEVPRVGAIIIRVIIAPSISSGYNSLAGRPEARRDDDRATQGGDRRLQGAQGRRRNLRRALRAGRRGVGRPDPRPRQGVEPDLVFAAHAAPTRAATCRRRGTPTAAPASPSSRWKRSRTNRSTSRCNRRSTSGRRSGARSSAPRRSRLGRATVASPFRRAVAQLPRPRS